MHVASFHHGNLQITVERRRRVGCQGVWGMSGPEICGLLTRNASLWPPLHPGFELNQIAREKHLFAATEPVPYRAFSCASQKVASL
jgi:hypothetical protein